MNAKDAILYLYDKGLLNIDAIMKNKDSIMQELDNTTEKLTKCDPNRLFRKGDKVRIVKHNGRKFGAAPPTFQLGKVYSVDEDEDTKHCYVMLQSCDIYYAHPVAFLELVIPVEELEPFYLDEITDEDEDGEPYQCFMIKTLKGEDRVRTYYSNKFETIEQTKAAAEAECARLNAEYRKEQNND